MSKDYKITYAELHELGVTEQEIEEAGGVEALAHILWFLQNTDDASQIAFDKMIEDAVTKKKINDDLMQAFSDLDHNLATVAQDMHPDRKEKIALDIEQYKNHKKEFSLISLPVARADKPYNVQEFYQKIWGSKPHPALKLLVQTYFLDFEDNIPDEEKQKDIIKTVSLLRAYIAGVDLPIDAEEEQLVSHARLMYKDFFMHKDEFDDCPFLYLLDNEIEALPMKYRYIGQSLPVVAILKIFMEQSFYDIDTGIVEEAMPEEISIKNLMILIERLARKFKIWQ